MKDFVLFLCAALVVVINCISSKRLTERIERIEDNQWKFLETQQITFKILDHHIKSE